MRSVMQNRFGQIPRAEIPRSSFDLSHGVKTAFNAGRLIPFLLLEALPGDTISCRSTGFARLATPIKPLMDNMFMETFYFSIPIRQVWDNWEKFNGEQTNPGDSTDYTIPTCTNSVGGWAATSLPDYMGVPILVDNLPINSLPLRCYNHVYNQWFRRQELIDSVTEHRDDGPDPSGSYAIRFRSKRADYFVSCLPWPQKGQAVTVPIGDSAPIKNMGTISPSFTSSDSPVVYESDGTSTTYNPHQNWIGSNWYVKGENGFPQIYADLQAATGIPINDLRQSFQIQRLLERDARGGTRYPEILKAHFGVTDPSMLVLQRPEFLGGGSTAININPVQQTAPSVVGGTELAPTAQGNLSGFGTAQFNGHGFTKSFTEHCYVLGIVNVRADLTYQQGLERLWSRQTRYDFYWPALSNLGEQAVKNSEIYAQGTTADSDTFGYQERYAEYRFSKSHITAHFRSTSPTPLDVWHLAENFTALPVLGQTFIESRPPLDRVVAVPSEPDFLFDCFHKIRAARPMPMYGTPGMIDHF